MRHFLKSIYEGRIMRHFLIDTENIQKYDFIGDLNLGSTDTVVLIYSDRSKKIDIKDFKNFIQCGANLEFEEVIVGTKNALDFQLVANLALRINHNNEEYEYNIVSNDRGFEAAVEYLKLKTGSNINIVRTQDNDSDSESTLTLDNIDIDGEDKKVDIEKIIKNSADLSSLHNSLRSKYGNIVGLEIYKKVKNEFKNKTKA